MNTSEYLRICFAGFGQLIGVQCGYGTLNDGVGFGLGLDTYYEDRLRLAYTRDTLAWKPHRRAFVDLVEIGLGLESISTQNRDDESQPPYFPATQALPAHHELTELRTTARQRALKGQKATDQGGVRGPVRPESEDVSGLPQIFKTGTPRSLSSFHFTLFATLYLLLHLNDPASVIKQS